MSLIGQLLPLLSRGELSGQLMVYSADAQALGNILYPVTQVEIAAGFVPGTSLLNFTYPVGNVLRYGADPTGTTDSTSSIQKAFLVSSIVYFPTGTYKVGAITVPRTFGLVICGDGPSSILVQTAGSIFSWSTSSIFYTEGEIKDLAFKCQSGTDHTINTSGVGGMDLKRLFFYDTPAGKSNIFVNGANATYVHDMRFFDIRIYNENNVAGHSGLRFGPLCSDTQICQFIMNAGFVTSYCIYLDSGAQTITFADSHPYNANINILNGSGTTSACYAVGCTFDNATNDLISITNGSNWLFTNCHFEAIKAGQNGVTLANCSATSIYNCEWDHSIGTGYAVSETGTSNQTFIIGGNIGTLGNYSGGPFNLIGALSYARGLAGFNPLNKSYSLFTTTTTAQAQNTTEYYGPAGLSATVTGAQFVLPDPSVVVSWRVNVSATPASGQTFTFNLLDVNLTVLSIIVINNGSFTGSATVNVSKNAGDALSIQSVFSATSGSSFPRAVINITA